MAKSAKGRGSDFSTGTVGGKKPAPQPTKSGKMGPSVARANKAARPR